MKTIANKDAVQHIVKVVPVSSAHKGRAAEILVCFDFVVRGYEAVINSFPASPYDVIADVGGEIIRIQVKSTGAPKTKLRKQYWVGKRGRPLKDQPRPLELRRETALQYTFSMGDGGSSRYGRVDLFAFVALDTRQVMYVSAVEIVGLSSHKHFGYATFAKNAEGSLDRFLFSRLLT